MKGINIKIPLINTTWAFFPSCEYKFTNLVFFLDFDSVASV